MILLMTKGDSKTPKHLKVLKDLKYKTFHTSSQEEAVSVLIKNPAINMLIIDIDFFYNIADITKKIILVKNIPILHLTSRSEEKSINKLQSTSYGYIHQQAPDYAIASTIKVAFDLFNEKKKLRRIKELSRKKEDEYQNIFNNHNSIMMVINPETSCIIKANIAAENYYGWSQKILKTMKITDINILSKEEVVNSMQLAKSKSQTYFLFKHKLSDGSIRDVEVSSEKITFRGKTMLLSIIKDITERKQIQKKIEYFAYHDLLTGLPNRKMFSDKLNQSIFQAKENHLKFALFFIDLNSFKGVNDFFGHLVGDQLLIKVAQRLKISIRRDSNVFRLGGDEFAIILQDITTRQDAVNVATRLIKQLENPFICNGKKIFSSASIGISVCPDDGINADLLFKKSDIAMYKLKKDRKNSYLFYSSEIQGL